MAKTLSIIKIGGSSSKNYKKIIEEIANQIQRGSQIIIVHGGGQLISDWLDEMNIETKFVEGLRFTDDKTLDIVIGALAGTTNKQLVAELNKYNLHAIGIAGVDANLLQAEKIKKEIGHVGEIKNVNTALLTDLLNNKYLPVISPVAASLEDKGKILNVNADTVAIALAIATNAKDCILLSDVDGVEDENGKVIDNLTPEYAKELLMKNIIAGGMIPKVENAIIAAQSGVQCHIANSERLNIIDDIFNNNAIETIISTID
ncbi:MAG: acetylglutamate kinase [Dehalococcoidaceae bacterium]|nr:acetylglutamate kinase [Dehalococcoidaceae bacterium]